MRGIVEGEESDKRQRSSQDWRRGRSSFIATNGSEERARSQLDPVVLKTVIASPNSSTVRKHGFSDETWYR